MEENVFLDVKNNLCGEFAGMSDFVVRELNFGKDRFYILYMMGHASKDLINKFIIEPISTAYLRGGSENPVDVIVTGVGLYKSVFYEEAKTCVLEGNALVLFPSMPCDTFGYV